MQENPVGLKGIVFTEFTSDNPEDLSRLFNDFGFSRTEAHQTLAVDHWEQGDIHFLVNREAEGFAAEFRKLHGPSICSMGWYVEDAKRALEVAVERGAKAADPSALHFDIPAIYGIGDSLIYFLDDSTPLFKSEFVAHTEPVANSPKGFVAIDHLTNNVEKGKLDVWSAFYKDVFGFTEVRHFDIDGEKTGLFSYALRSPDGSFCIPINESKEDKSQIAEYLREYNGEGIQHIAFLTQDLLGSLDAMQGSSVNFLDIDDEYYASVYDRVPNVTEDRDRIRNHQVLIDGDEEGYLLQIFTKNIVGPIFIEIIQRKNHASFGEGNFGALFRSIERDQERRGVI